MKNPVKLLPPFLLAAAVLGPGVSTGGNLMNPYPPASCGSLGCNSLIETKLYQVSHPVVFQAYARSGDCFQVRALDLNNDLELIVISPNGAVYDLDDYADGYEEVFINATANGSYTIHVGHWTGAGVGSRLEVAVGRYFPGDAANCPYFHTMNALEGPKDVSGCTDLGCMVGR